MASELPKIYDPKTVENEVSQSWIKAGSFNAEPTSGDNTFCMVIPPPNVTAALHLGHALNNTLQDILIRWRRMQQFNTLWMPGTDHAGIATQTVVEKRILAEEGKKRTDFEREDFVKRIQEWKDEYEHRILTQLKTMGCSCDWRRTRFTMDEVCAKAVRETFFKLFRDELIYRGKRLVNWDPATQTVLADDEVEHEDVDGSFWYLKYPLEAPVKVHGETITHITVATTRPETMLGDTAVAMNPSDRRAGALVGKNVRLPLVGRLIPIIADEHVVLPDPESEDEKAKFSTGFLKVTPAHDPDDYQIGMRHDLEMINVMAPDGTISNRYGWEDATGSAAEQFLAMDRFEARDAIVEWFQENDLLEKVRPYRHSVGHSYRSHVPIEPYLSDQWYVAVKKQISSMPNAGLIEGTDVPVNSLAGLALKPLLDERLKFTPSRYAKTYQTWLENLRDWPISRQLWWGHQIPVWTKDIQGDSVDPKFLETLGSTENYNLVCTPHHEEPGMSHTYFGVAPDCEEIEKKLEDAGWTRDPDVLDTWFSSALWPFSTLGWPGKTEEVSTYYPGDVLCTAREIITLWVSRMVMMGQYCVGDIPFTDVFIHAMIQDGQGRKMSKSLGNGIDPLNIIDSHGSDAMRFTLASMTTQTQDVRMPVEALKLPDGRTVNTSPKFDVGRNFSNKLWNASRFAMMNIQSAPTWDQISPTANICDAWILSRLNATIRDVTTALENFRFNELADTIYHFMWDDLCDWYLEIAKIRINAGHDTPKAVVAYCLDILLRLLHPVCPFITEAIWKNLNQIAPTRGPGNEAPEPLLVNAYWPMADASYINENIENSFSAVVDLIRQCRNVRTEHNVVPSRKIDAIISVDSEIGNLVTDNIELICALAGLSENVEIKKEKTDQPANSGAVTAAGVTIFLLDVIDTKAEIARLEKQLQTLQKGTKGIEGKLANENFLAKAPPQVVQKERERLTQLKTEMDAISDSLKTLQNG